MGRANNDFSRSAEARNRVTLGMAAAVCVAILWFLYFHIPYSIGAIAGEHPDPIPISSFLAHFWSTEEWQHCWLVLPALAFIVFQQRRELAALPTQGCWSGLAVIALAFATYWAGYRVDNYYLGYFSIQILVGGFILWFGGWRWMKALAFPFAFMLFMWPLHVFEGMVTFPLRMLMSSASGAVLDVLGVPIVRRGTGILSAPEPQLGIPAGARFQVDVADPCSGIRSLFALMMVSALYAHFTLKTWWQKGILFLSSIPLAILGNLCRILMLTFGTIAFGTEFAIGKNALTDPSWFHMFAGYLVFGVALGGMVSVGKILDAVSNRRHGAGNQDWRERMRARLKISRIPVEGKGPDPY